ncbi:MAG: hydrogenase expression/formation protein HypD [Candidatus Frackibacter sp. T328-2]|nr:MAG: hydrogenase expression/formation protein HypD [Candidatus Frackibacter sp. T328-2]
MQVLKKYRDPELIKPMLNEISELSQKLDEELKLMEVCGTHTMAISKYGLRSLLPKNIKLLSGPGCPVCVTSQQEIDEMIALSKMPEVIVTTFGDMIKVPGSNSSLEKEKSRGADIRIVYSPLAAVEIAKENPEKIVVFLAVGFETTIPVIAAALEEAIEEGIDNFKLFVAHKLIPPALEALLNDNEVKIDGLICPGHVSIMIGSKAYEEVVNRYDLPAIVAGFEPLDILDGVKGALKQKVEAQVEVEDKVKAKVENRYGRVVKDEGNQIAQDLIRRLYQVVDTAWRGIGIIPNSGLELRDEYAEYEIRNVIDLDVGDSNEPQGCSCGEILKGIKLPYDCQLFGDVCNPQHPVGPCMVSSEGSCAAYYKYDRR